MASITTAPGGYRLIQFVAGDNKRKTVRLGKVSKRIAEEVLVKVEALNAAAVSGFSWEAETAKWVVGLSPVLANKLAAVGLIPNRPERNTGGLGEFLTTYIDRRTDVKPNTRRNLLACKTRLTEFFGQGKSLQEITPGDADTFLLFLREKGYANGTAGRTVKRAKQFFRVALRQRIILENPFADVKPPSEVNDSRKHFIGRDVAEKVIDACPSAEWRLLFALSRFGGLRCPSEHLTLKWAQVDWERSRFLVHSPKTEHHEGGGERWVPIFPELRPHLEAAFDMAPEGAEYIIDGHRDTNTNLRTQLLRIIRKAGIAPWPKLFQNLRATRETELAEEFPLHVVCEWIGNSIKVAANHYLQVTEEHFQRAANSDADLPKSALQIPVQQPAARSRRDSQEGPNAFGSCELVRYDAIGGDTMQNERLPPVGLEPTTR